MRGGSSKRMVLQKLNLKRHDSFVARCYSRLCILTTRRTITKQGEETEIITKGRHDPCVGIRAVPVGEAMMACVLLDHLLLHRGQIGTNRGRIGPEA